MRIGHGHIWDACQPGAHGQRETEISDNEVRFPFSHDPKIRLHIVMKFRGRLERVAVRETRRTSYRAGSRDWANVTARAGCVNVTDSAKNRTRLRWKLCSIDLVNVSIGNLCVQLR